MVLAVVTQPHHAVRLHGRVVCWQMLALVRRDRGSFRFQLATTRLFNPSHSVTQVRYPRMTTAASFPEVWAVLMIDLRAVKRLKS